MKVKDFLSAYFGCGVIRIRDSFDFTDHRYNDADKVIEEYGSLDIRAWTVERDGTLVVVVNSQF